MTKAMEAWRRANPHARRTLPTAVIHNGADRTVYGCICGSEHSVATRNRNNAVHVKLWRRKHAVCDYLWYERVFGLGIATGD